MISKEYIIHSYDFKTTKSKFYGISKDLPLENNKFPLSQNLHNNEWIENYNTNYDLEEYIPEITVFGSNFIPVVQELTYIIVINKNFNNSIFSSLVDSAYQLFFD